MTTKFIALVTIVLIVIVASAFVDAVKIFAG